MIHVASYITHNMFGHLTHKMLGFLTFQLIFATHKMFRKVKLGEPIRSPKSTYENYNYSANITHRHLECFVRFAWNISTTSTATFIIFAQKEILTHSCRNIYFSSKSCFIFFMVKKKNVGSRSCRNIHQIFVFGHSNVLTLAFGYSVITESLLFVII